MIKVNPIKTLYNIILGALLITAVLVVLSAFPIKGIYQIKVVQSGSMEPAIKTGSVVIIKPSAVYKIGEVITFESQFKDQRGRNIPVTHRITEIKVEEGLPMYITKGDANDDPDPRLIRHQEVIGKLAFNIPYLGYVIEASRTPYGFFALVIIPAGIVIIEQLANILKEIKKQRKKKMSQQISAES